MPITETIKPLEGVRKKVISDAPSESETRKRSGLRDFSTETQSRGDEVGTPTSGRSVKKAIPKKVVPDPSEKKIKTPLNGQTPKKAVQRAKASISLNKTVIEKVDDEKKKRLPEIDSITRNSSTVMKEPETVKLKTVRSKLRQQERVKPNLGARRVPSAKKKNWATVVKKESPTAVKEEEPEKEVLVEEETKTGEIQTEGMPISSCSFFEKLQQGVRAYFASRNSLTEEKNKKKVTEGGIRTGAGVAKGGKEETKARTQERKVKNKIKYLDSDLFYDRPRLKSNSGGQKNNFLVKHPKIFRNFQNIKRKKLYHPKKHYVSIQIPRKGYFYRSFELRPGQSTTSPVTHGMASPTLPTKSEIQIARMASTSPKSSNIHKKGIKKSEKNILQMDDEFSLARHNLETTNIILNSEVVAQNFENEVNRMILNWPIDTFTGNSLGSLAKEKELPSQSDLIRQWEAPKRKNILYQNNTPTEIQKRDEPIQIESRESYTFLENLNSEPHGGALEAYNSQSKRAMLESNSQSNGQPVSSFDILMNCLRESLNQMQPRNVLNISPAITAEFETYPVCNPSCKIEKIPEPESIINPFDVNLLNIPEKKFCVATAFCNFNAPFKFNKSDEQFADLLLGDIDLHLEFQNYLKESKSVKEWNSESISMMKKDRLFHPIKENLNFDSPSKGSTNEVEEKNKSSTEIISLPEETPNVEKEEASVKETQSEIGCQTPLQETSNGDDFTFENPSFFGQERENKEDREKLLSHLLSLLFKKHNENSASSLDCYEKVSPMKTAVKTKKSKSKLQSSSFHSVTSQPKPQIKNVKPQSPNELVKSESTDKTVKTDSCAVLNRLGNNLRWCPSWNKLAEVCSYFRRQIRKLEKKSKHSKNSGASLIISLLNKKLQDKDEKLDVTNLMKMLKEFFQPPPILESIPSKNHYKKLEFYVNTFQEILQSSMSIEQIVYLNSVINEINKKESETESEDDKNSEESETSKVENTFGPDGEILNTLLCAPQEEEESTEDTPTVSSNEDIKPEEESGVDTPIMSSNEDIKPGEESTEDTPTMSSNEDIKPKEESQKVESLTPKNLDTVLETSLNLENPKEKPLDKILVNVKLCGSRVVVSDFSYIRDERFLNFNSSKANKTSGPVNSKKPSGTLAAKPSLSRASCKSKEDSKIDGVKIVLKSPKSQKKTKTKNSESNQKQDAEKSKKPQKSKDMRKMDTIFIDYASQGGNMNTFEYDQDWLKLQHPIDAIIETSETKIIEYGDNESNTDSNEIKALEANEILDRITEPEFSLKGVFYERLLKSNDEPQKSSCGQDFIEPDDEILTRIHTLSDVQDLQKEIKKPEVKDNCEDTTVQEKAKEYEKVLKKVKKEVGVVKKTSSKVERKKTESKVLKRTPSKGVRKQTPNSTKVDNAKGKAKDSKDCKKITYASQLATSERLSKRPGRLPKKSPIRQKQKPTPSQPGRSTSTTNNLKTVKMSVESLLFSNESDLPDVCSEASSAKDTRAQSCPEKEKKNPQSMQSDNCPESVSTSENYETIDKGKKTPVVIFSTPNGNNDVVSQFAIIRSDSILKTLSRTPANGNKNESVFESDSDLKFYPGRVQDSAEEQQPWITFVLTPEQQARAHLPNNQVQIVDKFHITDETEEVEVEEKSIIFTVEEEIEVKEQEVKVEGAEVEEVKKEESESEPKDETQNPLRAIEKFIDELRQNRLRNKNRQERLDKVKNERRNLTFIGKWPGYPVTQKQKFIPPGSTTASTLKTPDKKTSGSEIILAKVIVTILELLLYKKENCKRWCANNEAENKKMNEKWEDLQETASEMIDSVIHAVTQTEKLVNRIKLILAVKAELQRKAGNSMTRVRDLLNMSKKIKALKGLQKTKINDPTEAEGAGGTTEEAKQSDSKEPAVDLEQKPSVYFDAEEVEDSKKQLKDQCGKPFSSVSSEGCESEEDSLEGTSSKAQIKLTPSDENLLSAKTITDEIEEIIFSKIHENLQKNKVVYSMVLFDSFVNRKNVIETSKELQNDLHNVDKKTKKLLQGIEKSAWIKLYSLLEEVSRVYENQPEEKATQQLNKFINKALRVKNKMAAIYDSLSPIRIASDLCFTKIFAKIYKLRGSKNRTIKRANLPIVRFLDDERTNSGFEIRAAKAVHNFCSEPEAENNLDFLKNQIKDQRLFLEHLMNCGCCSECREVNDLKNKVTEKINVIESSITKMKDGCQGSLFMNRLKKFLTLTRACRNFAILKPPGPRERPV